MRPPGLSKRQKELARARKQNEKAQKREQRRREKAEGIQPPVADGEDPDLAGIIPGPQPPLF